MGKMMNTKSIGIFFILAFVTGLMVLVMFDRRYHYHDDYKDVVIPMNSGVVTFRLRGENRTEDVPKRVNIRSNPYDFYISYDTDIPFKYGIVSDLKFINFDNNDIVFEKEELKSNSRRYYTGEPYAGFYYDDISKLYELEYVDYLVTGVLIVCDLDVQCEEQEFNVVLKRDYKEEVSSDFVSAFLSV
jgi:hypothetical protein